MNGLLIPFGLDCITNTIVEPEDAARGRGCNCICPGCYAPLLSRHPKEHRIHFAHDSKHPSAKPSEECPFSSAVAIAMMAREMADNLIHKTFLIPALDCSHYFKCCGKTVHFSVTTEKPLTISHASKKPTLNNQVYDLEIGFGNAKILIDLVYKGKPAQRRVSECDLVNEKAGILAINCDSFDTGALAANKKLRFSDAVQYFLLEAGLRVWRFHPRQAAMLADAISSHTCKKNNTQWGVLADTEAHFQSLRNNKQYAKPPRRKPITVPAFEPKMYQCEMCKREWLQKVAGAPVCPQCNTHLFAHGI